MSKPLRHVKKEIRLLGLDSCNPRHNIGAVVRGGLYLDGIMSFAREEDGRASFLAKKVVESRYFPELRTIMLHDPRDVLDPVTMQRVARLPVITVSLDRHVSSRGYRFFEKDQQQLWIKTSLESPSLEKILSLTQSHGKLPEPLRIAHLLARLNIPRSPRRDKE
jgi:endonuclease V-like protein UPF0215 family